MCISLNQESSFKRSPGAFPSTKGSQKPTDDVYSPSRGPPSTLAGTPASAQLEDCVPASPLCPPFLPSPAQGAPLPPPSLQHPGSIAQPGDEGLDQSRELAGATEKEGKGGSAEGWERACS